MNDVSDIDPEDTDRLKLHPEVRLEAWQRRARRISEIAEMPIEGIGAELSRSVLVDPEQPHEGAQQIVARLEQTRTITPEERANFADARNALVCIGIEVPHEDYVLPHTLVDITCVEPPFPGRLRGGFAALATGKNFLEYALRVARPPHYYASGGLEFPGDVHKLLGYAIWIVKQDGSLGGIRQALARVADELDELCDSNQFDEATALWLARFAFHTLDGCPLGEVAARAHEWLWKAPAELAAARARPLEFPIGATLGNGAYRIEHRLAGTGLQLLYRGVEIATGAPLLIAYDVFRSRHDVDELRAAITYDAPGLLPLVHVGHLDGSREMWTVVERASGTWLPRLVGPAEPWTAQRKAIELGVSAGRILLGALPLGPKLLGIRPELMWGELRDGHYEVTGLGTRSAALFARSYQDAFTHPLYLHQYRDPMTRQKPYEFDDRSLSFTIAVCVVEWMTGTYPLLQTWGNETADHYPIEAPPGLRELLERALSPELAARPSLAELVTELPRYA